jgi:hypothetical protein
LWDSPHDRGQGRSAWAKPFNVIDLSRQYLADAAKRHGLQGVALCVPHEKDAIRRHPEGVTQTTESTHPGRIDHDAQITVKINLHPKMDP